MAYLLQIPLLAPAEIVAFPIYFSSYGGRQFLAIAELLYLPLQQQKVVYKDYHTWKIDSLMAIINWSSRRKRYAMDINIETELYRFSLI